MKKSKRRNHTGEFKGEAVKLVTEQHYKITKAARNFGIHNSLLRRWIKARSPEGESSTIRLFHKRQAIKDVRSINARC